MQERTFEGIWWLPEAPERAVGGRLEYRRETGHHLDLFGTLADSVDPRSRAKVPVLFGSVAGTDVTLFDAWPGKGSFTIGRRYARQQYRPELALLGGHLESRGELAAHEWTVHFTQLSEWLQVGGFDVAAGKYGSARPDEPLFTVTYAPAELPGIATTRLNIAFGFETQYPLGTVRELNLREVPRMKLKFRTAVEFDAFRAGALWQLQNFLTFAADTPNLVDAVFAHLRGVDGRLEVIYHSRFEAGPAADPLKMLFTYPRIAERATALFERWFEVYDTLGPVLNAMFSVTYGSLRSTDTKFLTIAQAAESYHRRMFDPADASDQHKARIARILATAPTEDADWLKGKLAFSGEPFLNERLNTIFSRLSQQFTGRMFATEEEMQEAARQIGRWRNKLTHMRAKPQQIASHLVELHVRTVQLLICLKANVLLDLGFSPDDVVSAFQYNDSYNYSSSMRSVNT